LTLAAWSSSQVAAASKAARKWSAETS